MDKQIEFCGPKGNSGCFVIENHFSVTRNQAEWTVLDVRAAEDGWGVKKGELRRVYTRSNTSVSVNPNLISKNREVFLFLGTSDEVEAMEAGAHVLHSYAEFFEVYANRSGQRVIKGLGKGSAIEANTRMDAALATMNQSVAKFQKSLGGK